MSFNSTARSNRSELQSNQQRLGNVQKLASSHHIMKERIQNKQLYTDGGQVQLQRPSMKQIVVSGSTVQRQSEESRIVQANSMKSSANLISMDEGNAFL